MSQDADEQLTSLTQFLYSCPVGLLDFDAGGAIGLMNPKAMQLLQPLVGSGPALNFFTLFESCGPELRNMAQAFPARRGTVCEHRRVFIGGAAGADPEEAKVFECTVVKLSDARFIATVADVSRQVVQERQLKQAEIWFSSLVECVDDFDVLSLDAAGRIDGVSDDFLAETGLSRAEVIGRLPDVLDAGEPDAPRTSILDMVAHARRDGWHLDESWHRSVGGDRRWCQRLIVVRRDKHDLVDEGGAPHGYVLVVRPMTGRSFDAAKLRHMLHNDYLTGACNRSHFYDVAERELKQAIRRDSALSVVTLDIDKFKSINDTHGHAVGDDVLKAITLTCQNALGKLGVFARLGGEEFAVLLPVSLDTACEVAETLRDAIATTVIETKSGSLQVTASFGCAQFRAGLRTIRALLNEADTALYAAKHGGRNRVAAGPLAA